MSRTRAALRFFSRPVLLAGVAALLLSAWVQSYVERRRQEENLTWTDPDQKEPLEAGLLALGGFRGVLADILWLRVLRHQDSAQYYELKLLCDLIQKLQPTFTQVHAFQAFNMTYNLANRAQSPEDKWYWIRSGISTLEKGLARNKRNHVLWFELGYQYFDRLGPTKIGDSRDLVFSQLPRLDDLDEAERITVFSQPGRWLPGRARPDENWRFAAYYFWKALQTGTEIRPLRTERIYGQCLLHLGYYQSRQPDKAQRVQWDDWGAEDWWLEVLERNQARGISGTASDVPLLLQFSMYQQMDLFSRRAEHYPEQAPVYRQQAQAAYHRFLKYFPEDTRTFEEVLRDYHEHQAKIRRGK